MPGTARCMCLLDQSLYKFITNLTHGLHAKFPNVCYCKMRCQKLLVYRGAIRICGWWAPYRFAWYGNCSHLYMTWFLVSFFVRPLLVLHDLVHSNILHDPSSDNFECQFWRDVENYGKCLACLGCSWIPLKKLQDLHGCAWVPELWKFFRNPEANHLLDL